MYAEVVAAAGTPRGKITEEEVGDNMISLLPSQLGKDPEFVAKRKEELEARRNAPSFTPYKPDSSETVPGLPSRIPDLPPRNESAASVPFAALSPEKTMKLKADRNRLLAEVNALIKKNFVSYELDKSIEEMSIGELNVLKRKLNSEIASLHDMSALPSDTEESSVVEETETDVTAKDVSTDTEKNTVITSQDDLFDKYDNDEDDDFDDDDDVSTRRANLTKALLNTVDGTPVSSVQRTVGKLDAGTVSDLAERLSGKKEEN